MALAARGIEGGVDINVLVDDGATGDMEVVKLAIGTLGSETLVPGDGTNGLDVDVTRITPGTAATNLGKAEDDVAASGDVGVMALAVQRTTAVSDAIDGDYVPLHTDALGRLQVTGTQLEDAIAATGDAGHFVLAVRRDAATSGAAAGDYHELQVDALGKLRVTGSFPEDAPATTGDEGQFILAVRRDAPTSGAAAGDYHELAVDALGRLWISGTQAEDAIAGTGDTGHFMLAIRRDTAVADAAAGDYTGLHVDALGKLRITGTYLEDDPHTTADAGHFVMAVQSLARTARSADGDYTPFAVGAAGEGFHAVVPEANAAWVCSNVAAVAAASGVIKASAGKLYGVTITNDNAAARYIQFFNLTAVPADATVPLFVVKLAAGESKQFDFSTMGKYFATGICWSNSTTFGTKTIGTADSCVEARFL